MGSVLASSPAPRYFAAHPYATAEAAIIGFSKSTAARYFMSDNASFTAGQVLAIDGGWRVSEGQIS
jgi:hypothetical protein